MGIKECVTYIECVLDGEKIVRGKSEWMEHQDEKNGENYECAADKHVGNM